MYEDLRTDYAKLESPPILTEKIFFCPAIGGGLGPRAPVVYASGKNHFSLSCMADTTPDLRLPPAAGHHRLLTGTKLYCLVTEAWVRCSGVVELLPTELRNNNYILSAHA